MGDRRDSHGATEAMTFEEFAARLKEQERVALRNAKRYLWYTPEINNLKLYLRRLSAGHVRVRRLRVPADVYDAVRIHAFQGADVPVPEGQALHVYGTRIERAA
jgi:hypothetical protein